MDWDRIQSTVREAYRKNGKPVDAYGGGTPLSDLIAKDPVPAIGEMTEQELCEFAADHHVAIGEGFDRAEMISAIKAAIEINWEERTRGMTALLEYLYEDGPHPVCTYRRLAAVTKAIRPQLTLNMSCAQLAVLCDDGKGETSDGRATQSARIKRLFEEPIRRSGMSGYKASFQKSDSAVESYRRAQQGNSNRLGRDAVKHRRATAE